MFERPGHRLLRRAKFTARTRARRRDGAELDSKGRTKLWRESHQVWRWVLPRKLNIYAMNGSTCQCAAIHDKSSNGIHYFTVQWPTDSLSWADFRSEVLGATDPAAAAEGSAPVTSNGRRMRAKPNVGDNGVHPASPFQHS